MGHATSNYFGPAPWGPVEEPNSQISFNLKLQSQFQSILYQTLCVFSQMKDTKHIRRDFHSVAWGWPQGWDFGALGVTRGVKKMFFKHGHVAYQINGDDEQNRMQVKILS